jgi:hypothetical protein
MPTTEANVALIQKRASEATTQEILDVLDEVQLIAYSANCFQTQKIESTGMPPLLVTTSGIMAYTCPIDCRSTACVFSETPERGYSRITSDERSYYFSNKKYVAADIEARDANISDLATIKFHVDPGTTTDKYYHLYYVKPIRLTSIDIELTLPEETHWLLRKAVVALLTSDSYGDSQYELKMIDEVAKRIRSKLNAGTGSSSGIPAIQPEYLDYPGMK